MDHLTKKDRVKGVDLTNTLALAYFAVIRQRTSSGLLQQGKYRGRQICENMLNLLTAVISPCKSRPPQQAAKLLLKMTPEAHCPLSSGQKKRERRERIPQKSAETCWLQKVKNSPPTSKCLSRIPDTHLALCGSLQQGSDFLFPPQVLQCKLNVWGKKSFCKEKNDSSLHIYRRRVEFEGWLITSLAPITF